VKVNADVSGKSYIREIKTILNDISKVKITVKLNNQKMKRQQHLTREGCSCDDVCMFVCREQLVAHNKEHSEEDSEGGGVAQPDLLATTGYHRHEDSGERIGDAIVSPLMRRRHQEGEGDVSPFMRSGRSGTVVKRRKKPARKNAGSKPSSSMSGPKSSMGRSSSLPNLAELDNLEEEGGGAVEPVASKRHTFFPMHE